MVWECPSATTLTKPTPQLQRQKKKGSILSNPLTEARITQKNTKGPREEVTPSLPYAIPLTAPREAHTAVAVRHTSHHTNATTQSGHQERKPPLSEAQFTQNTHIRLAYGDSRRFAPDPSSNLPDPILTQRARLHILTKHRTDDTDRDMHTESAPCKSPAQCKPNTGIEIGHPNNHQPDTHTQLKVAPVVLNT